MTLLPFEDLPEKPAVQIRFAEFWSHAVRKIAKRNAEKAYRAAIIRAPENVIIEAWADFNRRAIGRAGIVPINRQYIPYAATWLNGNRWEDEYDDRGLNRHGPKSDLALQQIAEHVKKSWYQFGTYPRDVLQECVDAGLLTVDEMEDKL